MSFRPPAWAIIVTLVLTAVLLSLGTWQLNRGWAKRDLEAAFDQAGAGETLSLDQASLPTPPAGTVVRARASGRYVADRQLLLDNQPRERVPGYRVWTVLDTDTGMIVVDRGWVAADPDRSSLPDTTVSSEMRSVSGFWRALPEPGLRLEVDHCSGQAWPRVVNYPTHAELQCILGGPVQPGLLLLDAAEADGFVREWTLPNPLPPSRHYGYAAQWFALAATLLFLFFKLNFKPRRHS